MGLFSSFCVRGPFGGRTAAPNPSRLPRARSPGWRPADWRFARRVRRSGDRRRRRSPSGAWITSRSSAQRYEEILRSRHCCTHCTISVFSSMRATASACSGGDSSDTSLRLALRLRSSSMHADGGGKERLEPRDVVAHVLDQLLVARGMRAVRLVDQRAAIGGAVEHHLLPPWRRQRLVIAEHALPGGPRMRRLDQGIGEIAELAFVFGELELRCLEADAAGRLGAEPAMHVVVAEIAAGAAEIAAAAAAERGTNQDAA